MWLVKQTNPVTVFSQGVQDGKKGNFIIRFTAHQSSLKPNAIVLTGLMGNSHASLSVESSGTQSGRYESERDQAKDPVVKLHSVREMERNVTAPESFW